ncbi:PEGA domain-containing protein [Sorangium sp. So ce1153]|uniref:PEGA domain-containing protein n=1 Tax=Sorangium sp. So ce1153 TaxID=3133333 RepID=UPI003F644FA8
MPPRPRTLMMLASLIVAASPALAAQDLGAGGGEAEEKARTEARELVYAGDELFAQKKYAEALRAYQRAEQLVSVPTTSIEVAKTLAAIGRLSEARDLAATIAASHATPGEPWPFMQARRRADALRSELDQRIPRLKVTIKPSPPGARLKVDGQVVKASLDGASIDPGNHWVEVEADGYVAERQRVYVPEKETTTLDVSLTPVPPRSGSATPWIIGGFVASGAGLALGLGAGAAYLSARGDLAEACRQRTASCSEDARGGANTLGWVSNVGFGLAIAGAAVGGVALGMESSREPASKVTWAVGPGYISVRGTL